MVNRPGDRLLEVELLEDDLGVALLDHTARPTAAGAGRSGPGPVHVRRWAWAAAAGLVAVAVAVGTVAGRAEDAALEERLADVAGLSTSLDMPLREAWRVPASDVLGAAAGTLVTRRADGDGAAGVDAASGTVRWSHDGRCELVPVGAAPAGTGPVPALVPDRPDDLVLCVEELRTGGSTTATWCPSPATC